MSITLNVMCEAVGAEVLDIDLADNIDDATFRQIKKTLHDRGVLLFRNQHLTEEQHIAFSRRFGKLEIHIARQYLLEEHPEIVVLSNKVIDGRRQGIEDAGRYWHSDLSYLQNPSLGSLLYAHEVPPLEAGGDTLFAGMYAAYDALDEAMKKRIRNLRAVHGYEQRWQKDARQGKERAALPDEDRKKIPQVSHPVVRSHPVTGRPALYVNEGFTIGIEGLPDDESRELLTELFEHSTRECFIYTHQWQAYDLIMWDNACVIHSANWYDPAYIRHMHRTTVSGPDCATAGLA